MENIEKVRLMWRMADAVTFDVDSTVIKDEGIDQLAKFCGKGDEVAALTKQAMHGSMTFQESLSLRLNIMKPTLTDIQKFISTHPPNLTPGIESLVKELQSQKKQVFLVSGGFRCLIVPIAKRLNIPLENIYANRLKFYFTGEYAGFDENQLTSKNGGKAEVIQHLKEEKGLGKVVHVGDGATDLEAAPPADLFIGFGGNVVRENIKSNAACFITDFHELLNLSLKH